MLPGRQDQPWPGCCLHSGNIESHKVSSEPPLLQAKESPLPQLLSEPACAPAPSPALVVFIENQWEIKTKHSFKAAFTPRNDQAKIKKNYQTKVLKKLLSKPVSHHLSCIFNGSSKKNTNSVFFNKPFLRSLRQCHDRIFLCILATFSLTGWLFLNDFCLLFFFFFKF